MEMSRYCADAESFTECAMHDVMQMSRNCTAFWLFSFSKHLAFLIDCHFGLNDDTRVGWFGT